MENSNIIQGSSEEFKINNNKLNFTIEKNKEKFQNLLESPTKNNKSDRIFMKVSIKNNKSINPAAIKKENEYLESSLNINYKYEDSINNLIISQEKNKFLKVKNKLRNNIDKFESLYNSYQNINNTKFN